MLEGVSLKENSTISVAGNKMEFDSLCQTIAKMLDCIQDYHLLHTDAYQLLKLFKEKLEKGSEQSIRKEIVITEALLIEVNYLLSVLSGYVDIDKRDEINLFIIELLTTEITKDYKKCFSESFKKVRLNFTSSLNIKKFIEDYHCQIS